MKIRKHQHRLPGKRRSNHSKAVLPALVAVSGGLASAPATAFQLGDIVVHSTIGQPLHASVVYALGPNETVDSYCVSVQSGGIGSKLPGVRIPSVNVAKGKITITGRNPVMDPMISVNLVVKCPYTPHVRRDYLLFIDPAGTVPVMQESAPAAAATPSPATVNAPSRPTAFRAPLPATPVEQAAQYLVQPGDSLSAIAMRIEGRDVDLQTAMDVIFDTNPEAFINLDPNLLQAGSMLEIPVLAGSVIARTATETPEPTVQVSEPPAGESVTLSPPASIYDGAEVLESEPVEEPALEAEPDPVPVYESTIEPVAEEVETDEPIQSAVEYADLLPGDVIVDDTAAANEVTPTSVAEAPAPRTQPVSQVSRSPEPAGSSWNWLIWIAAGVISVFAGVLLIGPRLRERFGSKPVGGAAAATRPMSEHAAPRTPSISAPEETMAVEEIKPAYDDIDFDLSDDSPTEENLALDADLMAGTGLEEGRDVDMNQDFGFAATTDLDLELTEQATREDESPETDIIPPPDRTSEEMVIESEVLPDDSQYDMSVLVDATKMPHPDDVTERDLKAVSLDETGQTPVADAYSIKKEVDFEILEQDYEEELTTTHALNAEIEKAAAELAERMEDEPLPDTDQTASGETSVEMQLANLSDMDLTANLEAQNDDLGEDDITAKIEAEDETVEMPKDKGGAKAS